MSKNAKKDAPQNTFVAYQKPIELWELNRVTPYEKNPRRIPQKAIEKVAASIQRFGWQWPILVDAKGVIVAGHTRYAAAKHLGHESVPVAVFTGDAKAAREFRIADNRVAQETAFDLEVLAEELQALIAEDTNLASLGFDDAEISRLIGGIPGLADEDEAPAPPATPVTKRGDVWLLGQHRLMCGDSTKADDVAALLDGAAPHLMVTDPPYGVEYDPAWRDEAAKRSASMGNRKDTAKGVVANDGQADWREAWALFPGDVAYVWHAVLRAAEVAHSLIATGLEIRNQIIWAKSHLVVGRGDYHMQHEPCWYAVRKGKKGHYVGGRKQSTLWQIDKPQKNETGYSTQKPVECMRRPIENNSLRGQHVYDPFIGSGTTIIAAEQTGRACYGMELNPAYVDVAVQRWQSFTGQQARLEATGEPFCNS